MQWQGRRESSNVDDRRGISGGGLAVGGGVIGVIFILAKFLLGDGDINDLQQLIPQQQRQEMTVEQKAADDKEASFVKVVLADTEDVWTKLFNDMGENLYQTYPCSFPRCHYFRLWNGKRFQRPILLPCRPGSIHRLIICTAIKRAI